MKTADRRHVISTQSIHYSSIDGPRALSCMGIILMHIRANSDYQLAINIMLSVSWYLIPHNSTMLLYLSSLALFGLWLSYAIGVDSKLLSSRPMKFLSGISMEMYLAQMIIFRVIEKIHLLYIFGRSGIRG